MGETIAMSAPKGLRGLRETCGMCRWADVERGFCRVTAAWIRRDRPLFSCRHFEPKDGKGEGRKPCS